MRGFFCDRFFVVYLVCGNALEVFGYFFDVMGVPYVEVLIDVTLPILFGNVRWQGGRWGSTVSSRVDPLLRVEYRRESPPFLFLLFYVGYNPESPLSFCD